MSENTNGIIMRIPLQLCIEIELRILPDQSRQNHQKDPELPVQSLNESTGDKPKTKLSLTKICPSCSKSYQPTSNGQKYCKKCTPWKKLVAKDRPMVPDSFEAGTPDMQDAPEPEPERGTGKKIPGSKDGFTEYSPFR